MADKLAVLINKLVTKTAEGKVEWEETATEGTFQVAYSDYTIRLFTRLAHDGTDIVVQILNSTGSLVEEATDVDYQRVSDLDGNDAYQQMQDMYNGARRKAMGVDHALDSLIESLDDDVPF